MLKERVIDLVWIAWHDKGQEFSEAISELSTLTPRQREWAKAEIDRLRASEAKGEQLKRGT